MLKSGTRIEMLGTPAMGSFPAMLPEMAIVVKPRAENLPLPGIGWHIVKFTDGGKLCVHEGRFRVVDNR